MSNKKLKKKKLKIGRILALIIFLVIIVFGIIFIKNNLFKFESKKTKNKVEKVESLENYDYHLYDNSTDLYKELFYELKDTLKEDTIDEEKYAKLIAELFVADFYSLDQKLTNQDVGGLDFVYSGIKDNLKLNATDTIYKYVKSNVYGDREQDLPEVEKISSVEVNKTSYKYSSTDENITINDENAYIVTLEWTYKTTNKYQKEAKITIVHENEKKLSIIKIEEA